MAGKIHGRGQVVNRLLLIILATLSASGCERGEPEANVHSPDLVSGTDNQTPSVLDPGDRQLDAGMVNPGYAEKPAWFARSFLDIRGDISEAAADNKRVMLYFYQDGCPYCKKLLDTNFALADTVTQTRENFAVIAINLWGDREVTDFDGQEMTEKEFARSLRVMFTPTLLFLNEKGKVVLRLNGYYPPHIFISALAYGASYEGANPAFREYLSTVTSTAASGVLHRESSFLADGTNLAARDSGKPLLVMFEQKECAPCDELHLDILKRPASREQLARFDVLLLDMWSNDPLTLPDGTVTTPAQWARQLAVYYAPSLVFFDNADREVFRTEAYFKAFHTQSAMDYVASQAYQEQPEFQRYIALRADALEAQGVHIDLME